MPSEDTKIKAVSEIKCLIKCLLISRSWMFNTIDWYIQK